MSETEPHVVGARYQLGEMLGRGGMAEVRKGIDLRLGREVAVKRLRTDLASDAIFQARFRREAQASASLNHPAIVSVYDTGEEMSTDGTNVLQPYIVMEYVAGRTLRDILREGRKILPERALEMVSGVLAALDYSHRAGIVHRDIKPGNVMLTPAGEVKVMDFGIARAMAEAQSTMTQTAAVVGTAQYLSPEQARGETVDSRSDVYSAGCLLFELLTGRPPFVGDSPVAVAYQHVREHPTPPSQFDGSLSPEIDAIVMKSLEKRVEDRYQSAAAMRNDIERYLAGHAVQAPPVTPMTAAVAAPSASETRVTSAVPAAPVEERRARWGWWVGGIVALIAVIAGGFFAMQQMFPDTPDPVAVPNVVGLTEADALAALQEADLKGVVTLANDPEVEEGTVISQDPPDGFLDPGSEVTIVVSSGKPLVEIPANVLTLKKDAAATLLESLDLKVKLVERESDEPLDTVLGTNPDVGTSVEIGSTVKIFYSDGPETIEDVVGLSEAEATEILEAQGFVVRVEVDNTSTEPAGTVTRMSPNAGEPLSEGEVVTIWVSSYVEPTPTETPTETATP